ncbi:MAG: PD40 domain-containing protein, partial [Victivallales bacterium]|nr:PD40 domain-containing protein [Victivallales bacterium]
MNQRHTFFFGCLALCMLTPLHAADASWIQHTKPEILSFGDDGNHTEPAVAANGAIAFQSDAGGFNHICILSKSGIINAITPLGHAIHPTWTPDGKLIYAVINPKQTS